MKLCIENKNTEFKRTDMITTEKTLSEVMEVLRQRGYTEDFNLLEVLPTYTPEKQCININDLVIDKIYRFTGQNDLNDEAILYAMHNKSDGAKGVFVNGYGIYTDPEANEIIRKITTHENDDDDWTIDCSNNC
jgi:hypothetical protein